MKIYNFTQIGFFFSTVFAIKSIFRIKRDAERIGETITQIASRYNVTKKEIITWNKLSSNVAKVGQRLLIILPDSRTEGASNIKAQQPTKDETLTAGN